MNRAGKAVGAFFGVVGVLMVLVGRELEDRGGEVGAAASVFTLIGMIWTAVAILLVVFMLASQVSTRRTQRQAELMRDASQSPDDNPI